MALTLASPRWHFVALGDLAVRRADAGVRGLSTHALGSCVAVAAFDPVARVGGLLHFMVPSARDLGARAVASQRGPGFAADTGVAGLCGRLLAAGAQRQRLRICAAGAAAMAAGAGGARLGERNRTALHAALLALELTPLALDLGGVAARSLSLCLCCGAVRSGVGGAQRLLAPACA